MNEKHYNTTVMFIDMAGYTAKTSKMPRKELQEILEEFEKVVKPSIENFGGKIIKGMGDAYLITFHSPTNSILCSMEIQKKISDRNEQIQDKSKKFHTRIGLSSGEVYERGGDIFGTPVNLASRIQSKGKSGDILFGESVYHSMNKNEINYHSIGKHSLKGINEKTGIYKVNMKKGGITKSRGRIKSFIIKYKWWIIIGLFIFLILVNADNKNSEEPQINNGEHIEYQRILDKNWFNEAQSVLEEDTMNKNALVEKLIRKYENAPEEEKNIQANVYAAIFYTLLDDQRNSFNAIIDAWNKAELPIEKRHVKEVAEDLLNAYSKNSFEKEKIEEIILNQKV